MFREVMNRRRMLLTVAGIGSTALLIGLLGARDSAVTPADEELTGNPAGENGSGSKAEEKSVTLEIACAENQLAFDPAELTAPANAQISLTFHNVSTFFMHNWVLVKGGEAAVDQVIQEGIAAGPEKDYLPKDMSNIIAHTPLVNSGESATITFAAPSAGEYTFLCTFPGHCLAGMRGVLTVTA
jgi:azurin